MSISELEARIEGFSTEIERHKEVLSELERSKSHAQRQLNALRDPLARIPVEISSEIFLHCVPTRSSLGRHHIPTLFLTICHGWSDIAVSIPALWAAIYIDLSEAAQGLETTVGNWLERARGHLLDVCLMGLMRETNQQVAELIWQYSGQLKSLDIDFANVDAHGHEDFEYRPLGDSGPQHPLPFLRTLIIGGHEELGCSWRPIHRLLSLAPHLVEFEASNMSFHDIPSPFVTELVLPNLRRLELSNAAALEWHTDILRWFSTPRLQNLSLPGASQDAVPFLQRLSPPLRRFRANIRTSPRVPIEKQRDRAFHHPRRGSLNGATPRESEPRQCGYTLRFHMENACPCGVGASPQAAKHPHQ
ncbi:hypothetical protein FB45DRAFT_258490 [Roridomyces roridus]|uniref:F-box domain-containing protein n=1 Tax=Roridomyces roridus TaxID=1738132 RepID=A0AAD7B9C4_9AGAR|nr:hypothetical protein FB45DRAFT_258490 [Roridomyces roridus]